MAPRDLVAALFLVALLFPGVGAAGTDWRVDETLSILDAAHAKRSWHIVYDDRMFSNKWSLAVPPGSTFLRAYSANGEPLAATVKEGTVSVTTDGSPFFADFREPLEPMGAYLALDGGPSASPTSPTSVRLELPAGWALAGWAGSEGLAAPVDLTWSRTGPFFVQPLLAPPTVKDSGPDKRGEPGAVVREARASLRTDHVPLNVTIVYDTDVYAPAWTLPIPQDARLLAVTAPVPNITHTVEGTTARIDAPYPFAHHLGPRAFTLHFAVTPTRFGGGFMRANLSIASGVEDAITLHVDDNELEWVGARLNGELATRAPRYATTGPMAFSVVFLPPPPAERVRFQDGLFIVEAPRALEADARAAAKAGASALPGAAPFAEVGAAPLHVIYTDEAVFGWEEGLYHGHDAISIRASDLSEGNVTALKTLVHEATHALVDRALGGAAIENSFLAEGLARLAETHIELRHRDAILHCETTATERRCTRDSSRVDAQKLQAAYREGQTFDPAWNASSADDEARGFLYDYSGFVLFHYERVSPPGALTRALAALREQTLPDDPRARGEAIVDALLHESPGMTRDTLLYPKKDAASGSPEAFAEAMGDLVAPPFPTGAGPFGIPTLGAPAIVAIVIALAAARRRAS